jgi:hypothetical protein
VIPAADAEDEIALDLCEDVITTVGRETALLAIRPGGWTVKVTEGLIKGTVTAGILSGIFLLAGFPALAAAVWPSILPLLFDLEKVRLTKKEEGILATLTLREEIRTKLQAPDELYASLPDAIREQLSPLDFRDFMDRCRKAGLIDDGPSGTLRLRPENQAKFRVQIL